MRPALRWPLLLGVLLLASGSLTAPARAQAVRGLVVEEGSARPIDLVFIVLIDDAGFEADRALSDESGRFRLTAQRPGAYRLRAERIGYQTVTSPPVELEIGTSIDYRLAVPVVAVELSGVSVEAERRCVARPEEGLELARVWEEARKALAATRWTEQRRLFAFRIHRYSRVLDPNTLVILQEYSDSLWRSGGKPFGTPPPEELIENGFVQRGATGELYFAPDAEVLLSDPFLDTHCFALERDDDRRPGLVGLAFRPVGGRNVTDVEGVLWLDERSAELRQLEFRYAGLRFPAHLDVTRTGFGGLLDFERLETGAWIIRSWRIRGPIREAVGDYSARAVQEEGGVVVRILSRRGASR